MDDHERLIRLLKLTKDKITEWEQPRAARRIAEMEATGERGVRESITPAEAAGIRLARMTNYVELADLWYRSGGTQGDQQDAYQLPGFALEAVTGLSEDMVLLIGSWVQKAYELPHADAFEVGRLWVDDVRHTAWRLLLEHGSSPGQHTSKRTPLEQA